MARLLLAADAPTGTLWHVPALVPALVLTRVETRAMAESDPWLPLCDAVTATGWKPERIRSLARRGTVPRKHGNGRGWLYQVTQELVAARAANAAADPSAGHMVDTEETARWQAVVADLQEEIVEMRIRLARAEDRAATAERVALD